MTPDQQSTRKTEQARIISGMKAYGMKGRAVDDVWVCDAMTDCDQEVQSVTQPRCPTCGTPMLQVLVQGEPIALS